MELKPIVNELMLARELKYLREKETLLKPILTWERRYAPKQSQRCSKNTRKMMNYTQIIQFSQIVSISLSMNDSAGH